MQIVCRQRNIMQNETTKLYMPCINSTRRVVGDLGKLTM